MTPREIVIRTLDFDNPERIAMRLRKPYPNDFCHCGPVLPEDKRGTSWTEVGGGKWEHRDEWGNIWARLDGFSKGEVERGVLEDWSQLDSLEFPGYEDPACYEWSRKTFAENPDLYKVAGLPGFAFSIARKMRRMETYLMDLYLHRDEVLALHARINDLLERMIDRNADSGADGIMFAEDWGTQDRLLVNPELWREIFKPGFERLCSRAHDRGMHVLMHSCGYVYDIIGDLIECGIDALQFDQPRLSGIERLSENFGGRVTFFCPVDIQTTLQSGDAEAIEADAKYMIEMLGCHGGGFIADYYGDNNSIGLDPKWQEIASKAFVKYGTYGKSVKCEV